MFDEWTVPLSRSPYTINTPFANTYVIFFAFKNIYQYFVILLMTSTNLFIGSLRVSIRISIWQN